MLRFLLISADLVQIYQYGEGKIRKMMRFLCGAALIGGMILLFVPGTPPGVGILLVIVGGTSIPFVQQRERERSRLEESRKRGAGPDNPNNKYYRR